MEKHHTMCVVLINSMKARISSRGWPAWEKPIYSNTDAEYTFHSPFLWQM